MKRLLIIRHAKSSWQEDEQADHERPLNHRGERDAPRMGRYMAHMGARPDRLLCSTAVRANATAALLIEGAAWDISISLRESLYLASPRELIEEIVNTPDAIQTVAVVGHNPGVSELISALTDSQVSMVTCAVAELALEIDSWSALRADHRHHLHRHWYPKGLPADFE